MKNNKNDYFIKRMSEHYLEIECSRSFYLTEFLDPTIQLELTNYFKWSSSTKLIMNGLISNAEYKRCLFYHNDVDVSEEMFELVLLKSEVENHQLTHRDILGALLSLGIIRNCFGDIIIQNDCLYLVCDKKFAEYIKLNLTRIGHYETRFIISNDVLEKQQSFSSENFYVNSLRLDLLISKICKLSRSNAATMITDSKVKLNFKTCENISYLCNNGDIISIRGYGRFRLEVLTGLTKNNKIRVVINKYL